MKKFYLIAFLAILLVPFSLITAQNLNWENPSPTGTGNATIGVIPGSVLLNGVAIDTDALIGVFYENDSGDLICGGYTELESDFLIGSSAAIAAWGSDPGEDNGFSAGETMNF